MANVVNYLKWRGDLSFKDSPFNEVDNLVLSMAVYSNLKGIVPEPGSGSGITVREAAKRYFSEHDPKMLGKIEYDWVLYYMAKGKRFGDLVLSDYLDICRPEENNLITAMTIHLPGGTKYVAFRGTTYEIDDWRMDFMISFEEIPAQKEALMYLKGVMERLSGSFLVGGHSKGGNLALYASMHMPETLQLRIKQIYSNDGPGICPELIDEQAFENIRNKLTHIVPTFCIVGMLFEPNVRHVIVGSNGNGLAQHTGMNWRVEGDHFVRKKHLNENSVIYNNMIDDWIESNSMEHREAFTRDFFDALKAGGAKYIQDIPDGGMHGFGTILLSVANSESKTRIVFGNAVRAAWDKFEKLDFIDTLKSQQGLVSISLILLGFIFFAVPESAYTLIGGIIAFIGVLWSGSFLLKSGTRNESIPLKRGRMIFWMIIMCFMVFLLSNIERIPSWTNILVAVVFFALAFTTVRFIVRNRKTMTKAGRFWMIVLAIVTLNIGVLSFMTPRAISAGKSITVGSYLVITGLVRLAIQIIEAARKTGDKGYCYEEDDD